nr:MAG TPA: PAB-dependent polyA-specific ribonuclease subunit [Caudoviricetes sp.]
MGRANELKGVQTRRNAGSFFMPENARECDTTAPA